jgi:DNA-directed RNA polymerase subunit RPC12/RpoP
MSNDDVLAGWELSVTMQRRTPLAWLLRHREFHEGGDPPTEIVPMQHACWVPVTRSWRSLGVDMGEIPETTMASEIGEIPVNGGDFLPFLIKYRMIVEDGGGMLTDLANRYPQYRGVLFPPSKPRKANVMKRRAPALSISILNYAQIPGCPDQYHFNFEFHCSDCGGYLISQPDDEDDPVRCTACGVAFDRLAKVKDACRSIALDEMKARKLGAFRET